MLANRSIFGFLLTRNWRDRTGGVELDYWFATDEGPLQVSVAGERAVFFLRRPEFDSASAVLQRFNIAETRDLAMSAFDMSPVRALYFTSYRQARSCADQLADAGFDPLEADINPADRYLMERYVMGAAELQGEINAAGNSLALAQPAMRSADYRPPLRVVSVDIETALEGVQLYSIGIHAVDQRGEQQRLVFMVGEGADQDYVHSCKSQREVLAAFLAWVESYDPDVLIGWNVVNFDIWYLQRVADLLGVPLSLGRGQQPVRWRQLDDEGERRTAQLSGRVILDGIELLRAAFYRFESFSLENVSRELLGEGKLLHGGDRGQAITDLFVSDKTRLAAYNIKDCELVSEIFEATSLLQFALARSAITGLNLDRLGGSVASFDNLYLPRLHRRGYVAPNARTDQGGSPGGFVLDSEPGIYSHVLVLDFKSLYPSIIRTFFIDPLGLAEGTGDAMSEESSLPGFLGARFAREGHILPGLIAGLWQQRDEAKAAGDAPLSQAIKIIMNSFYGVLGTPGCRFFDARLASSITMRGHEILQRTRDRIEELGHRVIYGDTDSVFVWVRESDSDESAEQTGRDLQAQLNQWWSEQLRIDFDVDSVLELEFETHFKKFLMPTVRGSDKGSKKRYAGVVAGPDGDQIIFKGLENVRTDWTRLAREFQEELYRRVFMDEPFTEYVLRVVHAVAAGQHDEDLVYRKRLRRRLGDYQRNVPPHVQAARLYAERGLAPPSRGSWIEYVITTAGAEPAASALAPLDHQHYIDRQLQPVADGILGFVNSSFRSLVDKQIDLF